MIGNFVKEYDDHIEANNLLANNYGSLSWFALFDKDYQLSESSAKKGLKLTPQKEWINTNLVLAYVLQGKYEKAKTIYINMKDRPYGDFTYAKPFLEDIKALEEEGIMHEDFKKIKELLLE